MGQKVKLVIENAYCIIFKLSIDSSMSTKYGEQGSALLMHNTQHALTHTRIFNAPPRVIKVSPPQMLWCCRFLNLTVLQTDIDAKAENT